MITTTLISKAAEHNERLSCRLKTLAEFKVIGCDNIAEVEATVAFLDKENVEYFWNKKNIIWTLDLEDNIQNLLINNMYGK